MKLTIGVPIFYPYVHYLFLRSYLQMEKPEGYILQILPGTTIAAARNKLAELAKVDSDYLLFLDADMVPPPDLIKRLMAHDKDIVGALAVQKTYPHNPTTMRLQNKDEYYRTPPNDELKEVDATGAACLLIKTSVFDRIEYPWFDFQVYKGKKFWGEDISFCRKAIEAGYKIYVDTSLNVGHVCEKVLTVNDWKPPSIMTYKELDRLRAVQTPSKEVDESSMG